MKEIAIVILNWNGQHFLEEYLPKLVLQSSGARIIVADNDSSDDSITFLKKNYPQIELILNKQNGGFAKGYNDALSQVQAKYYLIINSDIEVSENWLSPLFEAIQDEELAAVQPKILSLHKRNYFEHAGAVGGFIDKNLYPFCRGRIFNVCEEDLGQYDSQTEVFWTSGACMLIKANVFHAVNGFDEDFFAHMEEIDLCWRIKKMGYKLAVVPQSKVFHVGGGTLNYDSPNKVYLNFRNSLFMLCKNYEGLLFPKLFYRLFLDGIAAIQFIFKGRPTYTLAVLKAHFSFYGKIAKMLQKRKFIKSTTNSKMKNPSYSGSIVWAFYFKRIQKFSELNQRLFK